MEKPVMILGASGLGKVALDIFNSAQVVVYCFLDDDEKLHQTEIHDISVLGRTDDDGFLKYIGQRCEAFVAVEDRQDRARIVEALLERRKVMPVNAIHQTAFISPQAHIGHGNLIGAGVIVNTQAKVPNHCILHTRALIEYDVQLGDFVQIGAGAIVGAGAIIEANALIGSGAVIAPGVRIGKNAQVAPGSLVLREVPNHKTVFGHPAKEL